MKKGLSVYILIFALAFLVLGCGGGGGKKEKDYIGCYPKGTPVSSSAIPVAAGTLNANTFGGYYTGGKGDISSSCNQGRYDPSCVASYNQCIRDFNSCNANCNSCNSACNNCKATCTPQPNCKNSCPCTCPCGCKSCTFTCILYTPGPSTPASVGPSKEIPGFGWVWGDLQQCSTDKYEKATIYDADVKQEACACIAQSYWDSSGSAGKTCCGDDSLIPDNPPMDNADDPDVSENFCNSCKLGEHAGSRVWEPSVSQCCGDDSFGDGTANTDEPDWGETSCTGCLVGNNQGSRKWGPAGCCGDDAETDCTAQLGGKICSMDAGFESPTIHSSKDAKGDIKYIPCSDIEFLADGDTWLACNQTFTQTSVNEHDYLCTGKGKGSIYECCGDGKCNSDTTDGVRLTTGQSIKSGVDSIEKTFYCASNKTFTIDLDVKDEDTCKKAGFKWTGTKCCSENDDNLTVSTLREFYNDKDGTGGCWNSTLVTSVNLVKGTNDSVINYNGEFHGCAIHEKNYNRKNDEFLELVDEHTGNPLITQTDSLPTLKTNHDYCSNVLDNSYYCSYTEKWIATGGVDRSHLSFLPTPMIINQPFIECSNSDQCPPDMPICFGEYSKLSGRGLCSKFRQPAECCAKKDCWDGENCVANQRDKPTEQPIGDGFRCIDGNWAKSILKFTPDGVPGYCPNATQCLLNPFGKNESGQCINSTQYADDNYCENGKWSTRTKLLALELSGFIGGDYSLFCDTKDNALNNLQYTAPSKESAALSLSRFKPNNFCILSSAGKTISAVSFNKSIEEVSPASSIGVFGVSGCKDALVDYGNYHSCDSTHKVWYNRKLKSIIYSNGAINVLSEQKRMADFEMFANGLVDSSLSSIQRLIPAPPFDDSYLNVSKKFDRLYISQQKGRTTIGILEGFQSKNLVISYMNLGTNVCAFTEQLNEAKKDAFSGVLCAAEGNNYYVLAQGAQFTNLNPDSIWTDLTSKLRVK